MNRLFSHIKGTRKSAYLLMCFFLLFPLAYSIITSNNSTFDVVFFRNLLLATLACGIGLSMVIGTSDYYLTERLKNKLTSLELKKLGDGNVQLIDQYTGWSRRIKIEGTYENRKMSIDHRFEKGAWGLIPYLTIAIAPIDRIILEIKVDKYLTIEDINGKIGDVLAANKMYKKWR